MSPSFCCACIHRLTFFHFLEYNNRVASQGCDVEVWQLM